MRARGEDPDHIDPAAAERVILSVSNDDELEDIDARTKMTLQFIIAGVLVRDEQLSDAELDKFLADARELGDEILGE